MFTYAPLLAPCLWHMMADDPNASGLTNPLSRLSAFQPTVLGTGFWYWRAAFQPWYNTPSALTCSTWPWADTSAGSAAMRNEERMIGCVLCEVDGSVLCVDALDWDEQREGSDGRCTDEKITADPGFSLLLYGFHTPLFVACPCESCFRSPKPSHHLLCSPILLATTATRYGVATWGRTEAWEVT